MRKAESKITFDKASWVIRKQHCYKTFLSFQVFSVAYLRVPLREALICSPLREAEPKPCQGRQDDSVHQSRYEGLVKNVTFLVLQTHNRTYRYDVMDGDHVTHGGLDCLQGQRRRYRYPQVLGNPQLDRSERQVRNGV